MSPRSFFLVPLLIGVCGTACNAQTDRTEPSRVVYLTGKNTHQQIEEGLETRFIPKPDEIAERGISEILLNVIETDGEVLDGDSNYAYVYRFDRGGRVVSAGVPEYPSLSFAFDSLGRITRSSIDLRIMESGPNKGDTARMSIRYHYRGAPDTIIETSDYARGQVFHIFDPDTGRRLMSYSEGHADTTHFYYGTDGRQTKTLTYRGGSLLHGIIQEYGADGLLHRVLRVSGQGSSDSAVSSVTEFTYDDKGRVVVEEELSTMFVREREKLLRYEWNDSGLLEEVAQQSRLSRGKEIVMQLEYRYFDDR